MLYSENQKDLKSNLIAMVMVKAVLGVSQRVPVPPLSYGVAASPWMRAVACLLQQAVVGMAVGERPWVEDRPSQGEQTVMVFEASSTWEREEPKVGYSLEVPRVGEQVQLYWQS